MDYVINDQREVFDPYSEVDALVLSQAVYFPFESLVTQLTREGAVYVRDLHVDIVTNPTNNPLLENHIELLKTLQDSPVFSSLKVLDFTTEFNIDKEIQFAAMTLLDKNNNMMVVFRGTDFSTIGWKEDFNMTFTQDVPAQLSSVNYLNHIMSLYDYPVFIMGHSKGGNLSVYSASFCEKDYQLLIQRVYNFDGPGFHTEVIEREGFNNILDRIIKYIPRASVVGLFLDTKEKTVIIDSNSFSFLQHDSFNWKIKNGHFIEKDQNTGMSLHFSNTVREWLEQMDYTEREYLTDAVFEGLHNLEITSFEDPSLINFNTLQKLIGQYQSADPKFKSFLKEILWSFVKGMFDFRNNGKDDND